MPDKSNDLDPAIRLQFEQLELDRQKSIQSFEIAKLKVKWISGIVAVILALISAVGGWATGVFDFLIRKSQSEDDTRALETRLEKEYLDSYVQYALDKDLSVRRDFALYVATTARTDSVRINWEKFHGLIVDQISRDEQEIERILSEIEKLKANEYRNKEKIEYLRSKIAAISQRIQNIPLSQEEKSQPANKAPVEDTGYFYDCIRNPIHGGSVSQQAVEAYKNLFQYWNTHEELVDKRWLAYFLATIRSEVGANMSPVRETFASSDEEARRRLAGRPYGKPGTTGHVYYGRGYILLTWEENYRKIGEKLKVDLVASPDLALQHDIAMDILVTGMLEGIFNGQAHGLDFYINSEKEDPVNARRTVNVLDRAKEIAGIYEQYKLCLK